MGTRVHTKELSGLAKRFLSAIAMVGYTGYRLEKEIDAISSSMLTHIRSGRNEPSTQVIIAFLKKFPSINGHWILTGSGEPILEPGTGDDNKASSYTRMLHGIPVDEIAGYIEAHHQTRGFDTNKVFKAVLELYIQEKLNERLAGLEAKIDQLLSGKAEGGGKRH